MTRPYSIDLRERAVAAVAAGKTTRVVAERFGIYPIEQTFAKIKHWMRIAQKRTIEEAWRQVGNIVGSITSRQCSNYLVNSGYDSVKK